MSYGASSYHLLLYPLVSSCNVHINNSYHWIYLIASSGFRRQLCKMTITAKKSIMFLTFLPTVPAILYIHPSSQTCSVATIRRFYEWSEKPSLIEHAFTEAARVLFSKICDLSFYMSFWTYFFLSHIDNWVCNFPAFFESISPVIGF